MSIRLGKKSGADSCMTFQWLWELQNEKSARFNEKLTRLVNFSWLVKIS